MKKNRMMRLASILLICVLLSTSVISGTFAKYTSEATSKSTATVAKWSFEVGGTDIAPAANTEFTLNLFETINEADTSTAEEHVADDKIAPGTGGSFNLNLKNASEVDADYEITLSEIDDAGVPLEFSTNGTTWIKAGSATNPNNIKVAGTLGIGKDVTSGNIYWRWAFEGNGDEADTKLGTDAVTKPAQPSVTVKVVATQVD